MTEKGGQSNIRFIVSNIRSVEVLKTKVVIEYPKYHPMHKELSHALRFYQRAA